MGIKTMFRNLINLRYRHQLKNVGSDLRIGKNSTIIGGERITVGNGFHSGKNLKLQVWNQDNNRNIYKEYNPSLKIGNSVSVMENVMISCASNISIGDGVLMGDNVFISDNLHGQIGKQMDKPPLERELFVKGPIIIDENVWIGRNVCIIGKVHIGKAAIIGANAVVTRDVLPNKVVAGVPAREIK